jgi:hypothetical protein
MSLDNIQLPAIVIQEMFKNSLIDCKSEKQVRENTSESTLTFLGNNDKQVLILVKNADSLYMPDEELTFLLGILTACKLTMNDVAIMNLHQQPKFNYTAIGKDIFANTIIQFGTNPADIELPMSFPTYQLQAYNNQTYLCAPELSILQQDKAEKMKLWNCLKTLFSI